MLNKFILGNLYQPLMFFNFITRPRKNIVTILNYHGIPDKALDNFKLQIEWLKAHYNIINPLDFHAFLDGKYQIHEQAVLITFDDGFISSYNVTQQVLNSLNIKAVFFIPTSYIDNKNTSNWKENASNMYFSGRLNENEIMEHLGPMSSQNIKTLIKQGHLIGGHTNSHCNLAGVKSSEVLYKEIVESKIKFERDFNLNVNSRPISSTNFGLLYASIVTFFSSGRFKIL